MSLTCHPSAECAIRIAYYRGFFANVGNNSSDAAGAMMAVGTSFQDASDLCELPLFRGRMCVAAVNSPMSVTLSGDAAAVKHAGIVMTDEKKFARMLKVEKAYHSHYMVPALEPYLQALEKCNAQAKPPAPDSKFPYWVSSVTGDRTEGLDQDYLSRNYWGDNMAQTVLFSSALEYATGAHGPFDAAIEIGPHPALKNPALDTIKDLYGEEILYCGTLQRGTNDVEAIASTFGTLWKAFGRKAVDFDALHRYLCEAGDPPAKLIKGLPTYSWTHERNYWHETRQTRSFRSDHRKTHSLIGSMCPNRTPTECQWRNYLSPKNVPWLMDHKIQGQAVFPAAGYISAVIEALEQLYPNQDIKLIDFSDISIGQALLIPAEGEVEILVAISILVDVDEHVDASFSFSSDSARGSANLVSNASGRLRFIKGPVSSESLPAPSMPEGRYVEVQPELFYESAHELGYGYTGPFRGLKRTQRRLNEAIGFIDVPDDTTENENPLRVHPGILDSAIQAILLAYSYPGDNELRQLHLPVKVERLCVDVGACRVDLDRQSELRFQAYAIPALTELIGDVDVHSQDGGRTFIQLQGLHVKPLSPYSLQNDAKLFFEKTWGYETPLLDQIPEGNGGIKQQMGQHLEQVAYVVDQLSHRFPRMDILDVSAGYLTTMLGGSARGTFSTYTATEPIANFSGISEVDLHEVRAGSQVVFKHLDLKEPVNDQGSKPASYDLMIACLVLHEIDNLGQTLSQMRKLLRPGGYLIVLERTDYNSGLTNMIQFASKEDWKSLLCKAGFTVIATKNRERSSSTPFSLLLSQATDEQVRPLFEPLTGSQSVLPSLGSLSVVGDKSLTTSLVNSIGSHYDQVVHFDRFDDLASSGLSFGTFISFADCGNDSIFQSMTATRLMALQNMLKHSKTLLWASSDTGASNPHKNMLAGLLRTAVLEMTYLRTQIITFTTPEQVDVNLVARRLLELEVGAHLREQRPDEDILWHAEPEIRVEDGRIKIPRLQIQEAQNQRLASTVRPVTRPVASKETVLAVASMNGIMKMSTKSISLMHGNGVYRLRYSLLKTVPISSRTRLFLSLGEKEESGEYFVVLTSSLESRVQIPPSWTIPAPRSQQGMRFLLSLSSQLLVQSVLSKAQAGRPIVVLDANKPLEDAIADFAAEKGIRLVLLSTQYKSNARPRAYLHPRSSKRAVSQLLPADIATFVDLGVPSELSSVVEDILPRHCRKFSSSDFLSDFSHHDGDPQCVREVGDHLEAAWIGAVKAGSVKVKKPSGLAIETPTSILRLDDLAHDVIQTQAIFSWETPETVEIPVQPASQLVRFASDKTYWLLGLTGGLGQSLCRWMADRGATSIALTSRNPKLDEAWYQYPLNSVCHVRTFAA